ncbi:hypothetical protein ACE1CD_01930 [Aerosakkonema sp. BLCC-F183]
MMVQISDRQSAVLSRISDIVDRIMQSRPVYQEELNKNEVMEKFATLLNKIFPEQLMELDDENLTKRVKGVMSVELMTHLLDGLTPENVETFNTAVEGR